ncbi:MAG: SURF1 family protein [Betaproteobacteria bacterium]|nr:SURF1 family protein [Betaproteobacteria bacterium]
MVSDFRQLRFTPAPLPSLAALVLVALTLYLGYWQQGRATEKRALQADFDSRREQLPVTIGSTTRAPKLHYRRAVAEGVWHAEGQIFVDNKVEDGRVGYHVVAPLKLGDGNSYLLVNRGWVSRTGSYPQTPEVALPTGRVIVRGTLSVPSSRFLELSTQTVANRVWQNLTVERYRATTGLDVLPYVLLADEAEGPLKKVIEQPDARVEKHVEYMLTWYSLAVTVVIIWVATNLHRRAKTSLT